MARVYAHFIILISFLFLSLGYSMQYNFFHKYKTMGEKNQNEWECIRCGKTDFLKSSSWYRTLNISFNVNTPSQLKTAYDFYGEFPFIIVNDDDHPLSKSLSDTLGPPISQPEMILNLNDYKPNNFKNDEFKIIKNETHEDIKLFAQSLGLFYKLDSDEQEALLLPKTLKILNSYTSFMALLKGIPIGVISYYLDDHGVVSISNLAVDEKFRRQGVGRMLTDYALNNAYQHQAVLAILIASNEGEKLYQSMGFKTTKTWHLYFPKK
jgi:ribosomal protein S18 acetylase RimI-like enzyme